MIGVRLNFFNRQLLWSVCYELGEVDDPIICNLVNHSRDGLVVQFDCSNPQKSIDSWAESVGVQIEILEDALSRVVSRLRFLCSSSPLENPPSRIVDINVF